MLSFYEQPKKILNYFNNLRKHIIVKKRMSLGRIERLLNCSYKRRKKNYHCFTDYKKIENIHRGLSGVNVNFRAAFVEISGDKWRCIGTMNV